MDPTNVSMERMLSKPGTLSVRKSTSLSVPRARSAITAKWYMYYLLRVTSPSTSFDYGWAGNVTYLSGTGEQIFGWPVGRSAKTEDQSSIHRAVRRAAGRVTSRSRSKVTVGFPLMMLAETGELGVSQTS